MELSAASRSQSESRKSYRFDIEGLRAVAVLAVVAFDCNSSWAPGGFAGIDVFFVISGYLICSAILRELRQGSFSIVQFYARRCRRVIPALFVVLLFCLCLGSLILSPWEAFRLGDSVVAASLLASNFLFLIRTSFFAERALSNPLLMTWSLGVGMQVIVLLPLLLFALRDKTKAQLIAWVSCLTLLSFASCVYAEFHFPIWNFYLPVTRAWELGAGCLLAISQAEQSSSWRGSSGKAHVRGAAGLLMIAAAFLFYKKQMRFPGYEATLPVLGTLLTLSSPEAWINRILANRFLTAVGLISYPLYLWHWPLLSFAEIMSSKPLRPQTIAILMTLAAVAAVTSYLFVEKPFRGDVGNNPRKLFLVCASGMVALLFVGGVFHFTKGIPQRNPKLYKIESRAALYRHYPCISAGSYLRMSPECVPVASSSKPAIAILGGGHAEAFSEGLRSFASDHEWSLITLTRESCPPTKGVSQWSASDSTLADSCRTFNRAALDYVVSRSDIKVVVLVGRWRATFVPDTYQADPRNQSAEQNSANLRLGLGNEIAALESARKRVIVLEDVPEFPYDPVAGIRTQHLPLRRALNRALLSAEPEQGDGNSEGRLIAVSAAARLAAAQLAALKSADENFVLVDPLEALCNANRCFFSGDSGLYYFDSIHLSRTGAEQILPFMPQLKQSIQ